MNKLKYLLITFIMIIIGTGNVSANELKNLDINAYIDRNGNAEVTEVWDMYVDEGTEVFKPMANLGDRKITDFKVIDEHGTQYKKVTWDINGSIESKKNKNGINYTDNGLELCWGMGSYGNHTYTISYKISDVITSYNDYQASTWKLVNDSMDPTPNNFTVTISSYFEFEDTLDVWGYGYKGYAYVKDGKIEMSNEGDFYTSNYATLLVKFEPNTFKTTNSEEKDFSEVLEKAEEGTFEYDYNEDDEIGIIASILSVIWMVIVCSFVSLAIKYGKSNDGLLSSNYRFGSLGKAINKKEAGYFRDIPCNKDIFRAYWVATIYGLNKNKTDFLGAVLLKWLKEKQITIITKEKDGLLGSTKQEYSIDLTKDFLGQDELELSLYLMLRRASNDNILENKEFEKWCSNNYSMILGWFDQVLKNQKNKLIAEGKIKATEKITFKIFKTTIYEIDDAMKKEAIELQGLKNFLNDFTIIKDRKAIEVNIFEEYLMYAQIFGIAKKVAEEFKKLYPNVITDMDYTGILVLNSISTSGISKANSARSAAQAYSSGGGGFSSGGGGGGSFGGGSGGGCR